MSKLNNEQFSLLIDNLRNIEKRFIYQDKKFEIIENKLDKQDKSKWINNLTEPFSFAFIYRSISFYFSKNITADSIKDFRSYINKEKEEFKIFKLLILWILITIIRELFDFYHNNKEKKFLTYLNKSLKIIWEKLFNSQWLKKKNYKESSINLPFEINSSRNESLLI